MNLILQAIKAMFRKMHLRFNEMDSNIDKVTEAVAMVAASAEERMPLIIVSELAPEIEGYKVTTPYADIKAAFLTNRPVMLYYLGGIYNATSHNEKREHIVFMGGRLYYRDDDFIPEVQIYMVRVDENGYMYNYTKTITNNYNELTNTPYIPTDEYINSLIDAKLGAIENGTPGADGVGITNIEVMGV